MKILILLPVQPKIAKGKSKSFLSIILVWVLLPLPHLFLVLPSHLASHEVPRLRKKWTPAQICIQSDTELDTEMWHNMGQRSMCQLSDCNILVTGHKSRTKHNVYPACMNMAHYQNPGLRNTETIFSSNERSPQEKKKKKRDVTQSYQPVQNHSLSTCEPRDVPFNNPSGSLHIRHFAGLCLAPAGSQIVNSTNE